jgi:hypothetical protein
MTEIKIRGQLDESGLPHTFMSVVNRANNLKTAIPLTTVIDTGASVSLIKTEIALELGFMPIGTSTLQRPIEPDLELNVFNADIIVNDSLTLTDIKLKELTQKNYPCELILGMDIIKYCDFHYNSKDRLFDLIFHVPDVV